MLPADRILRDAAQALASLAPLSSVVVVDLSSGPLRIHFEGPPPPAEASVSEANGDRPPPPPQPGVLLYSPEEEAILRGCGPGWRTRDEIAAASGVLKGALSRLDFEALLRNLVRRGALEQGGPKGFRIKQVGI